MKFFNMIKNMFNSEIAIDLGSEKTVIYVKDQGIKLNEPTMVAEKHLLGEKIFIHYGNDAKRIIGKTPKNVIIVSPIKDGAIQDLTASESMLNYFIGQVHEEQGFFRPSPNVLITIPSSASEVEKKSVEDALYEAGARNVTFLKKGLAAAIGAGVDIEKETPSCIIDLGADTTEISVIASSGIIEARTFKTGGKTIVEAIEKYVLDKYDTEIGVENATMLMKRFATVKKEDIDRDENFTIVKGKSTQNKLKEIRVDQADIYNAMFEPVSKIIEALGKIFKELPAETISDLSDGGVYLCGGVSNIEGLDFLIENYLNLPTRLIKDPELCVIKGAGKLLDEEIETENYEEL